MDKNIIYKVRKRLKNPYTKDVLFHFKEFCLVIFSFKYQAGWILRRIRNSLWPNLWSRAIQEVRKLYILCNHISHCNKYPCVCSLDIHGQVINSSRHRLWNLNCSLQVCDLAHSCIICLRYSSTTTSLLPESELDLPNTCKHLCSSMFPYPSLLGSSI